MLLSTLVLLVSSLSATNTGDEEQAWTEDVMHFVGELERMHPEPFFGVPREEFEAAVDTFVAGIGADEERNVDGFMRLVAMLSRAGRDGHSLVWSFGFDRLPLSLYRFEDGWFVVATESGWETLRGQRVSQIAGLSIEDVVARLAPLLTRDNDWNLRAKLAGALSTPALLRGAGIQPDPGAVKLRLEAGGQARDVALTPVHGHPAEDLPPPLGSLPSSRGRERAWWSEVLPAERALYVQFNEVRASDAAGQSLAEFAATLAPTVEREALERVIVDVRWNGGGDNTTFGPLIDALRDPRLDRPGRLFGLIGRHTYSAAGNFVTVLERDTGAVLVGEPTGGAPNQYGDASAVHLPNHPELLVRVSTRYHAFSKADDPRVTHEPDVLVPLRSEDYFAGRDPVLARACTYAPK